MSRNMVAVQRAIFDRLAAVVRSAEVEYATPELVDAPRWIGGDANDCNALKHASIVKVAKIAGVGPLALLRWGGEWIFTLPGDLAVDYERDEDVLESISNAGLSSLILCEGYAEIRADAYQLVEYVFGRSGEYCLADITKWFSSFTHHRVRPSLEGRPATEVWSRCQALCAKALMRRGASAWFESSSGVFVDACAGQAAKFVGGVLLAAVQAGTEEHAFLEVYRAVESLFHVVCVEDLVQSTPRLNDVDRLAFVDALSRALEWRVRQENALARVVAKIPKAELDEIRNELRGGE